MVGAQILTEKQQSELHKAIIQYLKPAFSEQKSEIFEELYRVLDVSPNEPEDSIISNYLEKKWSTVLRLQKKIMDLENEVGSLRAVLGSDSSNTNNTSVSRDKINWLPTKYTKIFRTQAKQSINSVAIHPFLPVIACGCSDGSIIVWNITIDESTIPDRILKAHTRNVNRLVWSREPVQMSASSGTKSYVLASCSSDLTIKIWDGDDYKHIRTLTGHKHTTSSIKFSTINSGILYSVSRDKTVNIWDIVEGVCIKSFTGHSDWVRDIDVISINSAISVGTAKASAELGEFVITCSNDQSVRLSHSETGTGLALLIGHSHVIERVSFLPLHSNLIIDKYLKSNLTFYNNIPSELIESTTYTQVLGYKYCVSAGRDNTIKLWLLPPPVLRPHRSPLPAATNNSQGWLIADLIGHQSWVKALTVHPNGRFILSGSDDKTVKVWDLESLNVNGKVKCIRSLSDSEGFINDICFASYNFKFDETEPIDGSPEYKHKEVLKNIEKRMRCLFISGSVDNAVRLWT